MQRLPQVILIASTFLACWLGMQAIHELGHVIGAWFTGGQVSRVVLSPLTISRTDVAVNLSPAMVVWAGPLFGVVAPLIIWLVANYFRLRGSFVLRFFAGFCLLANGLYIAGGSLEGIGDCGVMLKNGSAPWQLWLFGAVTAPLGLWLWHQQGMHFGLGKAKGVVDSRVAYLTLVVSLLLLVMAFIVDGV